MRLGRLVATLFRWFRPRTGEAAGQEDVVQEEGAEEQPDVKPGDVAASAAAGHPPSVGPDRRLVVAVEAAAPSGEEAGDSESLAFFIEDFLLPIAADGIIDQQLEETPLIVAFHAYGIGDQLARDPQAVDAKLQSAIQQALRQQAAELDGPQLLRAWERINQHASKMSQGEHAGLRQWFNERAARHELAVELPDLQQPISFREQSLDRTCVALFHKYFQEARLSAAPVTEEPAVAVPEVAIRYGQASDAAVSRVVDQELQQELCAQQEEIVAEMEALLEGDEPPGLDFDQFRTQRNHQAVVVSSLNDDANLWLIGDVHGDLLGLECLLQYIDDYPRDAPARIVFLGDLFDDGELSYEVLLRVYRLILQRRDRICVLAGNHDESLQYDDPVFHSTVWPSNFTDWLNARSHDPVAKRLGLVTIKLFGQAPRVLFLPDGLVAAHGGVVHSDLWEGLSSPGDLNQPACLQDFVWTRLHERASRRIPNRSTRGCELGRQDFEHFCEKAAEVIGQPVQRMIRGHDHVDTKDRYAVFSRYVKNPVLTINAMCCRLPREAFGPYEHTPCIAHWTPGRLPEVHGVEIPPERVRQVYRIDQADVTESGAET
jgi:hypothetical protein